jgi:hypothetical protein
MQVVSVPLIYPQTHLESVFILDRNISFFSELQSPRNFGYKVLDRLSPTTKCPEILTSTTFLLVTNVSNVLVFLVWLSRLFQRFMTDFILERRLV